MRREKFGGKKIYFANERGPIWKVPKNCWNLITNFWKINSSLAFSNKIVSALFFVWANFAFLWWKERKQIRFYWKKLTNCRFFCNYITKFRERKYRNSWKSHFSFAFLRGVQSSWPLCRSSTFLQNLGLILSRSEENGFNTENSLNSESHVFKVQRFYEISLFGFFSSGFCHIIEMLQVISKFPLNSISSPTPWRRHRNKYMEEKLHSKKFSHSTRVSISSIVFFSLWNFSPIYLFLWAQRKWTGPKTMRPLDRIPVKNFELWKCVFQLEKQFPIVFIALRGPEPAPTSSSDICERHMLVTWYQMGGGRTTTWDCGCCW